MLNRKRWRSVARSSLMGLAVLLILLGFLISALAFTSTRVQALPEYSVRTGESCASCHVNPGGGGPRTLRGLLWSARGRPDNVPDLPGMLIAPRVTDAVELYEITCAGCHGYQGEGLSARGLINTQISQGSIRSFTLRGIPRLGMPGYAGKFTDEQLEKLVVYVTGLASGEIAPPPDNFDLPPALFRCNHEQDGARCGLPGQPTGGN